MDEDVDLQLLASLALGVVIVALVLNPFFGTIISIATGSGTTSVTPQTGSAVTVQNLGDTEDTSVLATRENALAFDGDDAVEASTTQSLTDGNWTVCATVALADDAPTNATYTVAAYENASILVEFDAGQWSVYYENTTSGNDAKATIDAPSPTAQTAVCGRYNGTHVVAVRDGTVSGGEQLDAATDARNVSTGWTGEMDELRTWNSALNQSYLNAYATDPVQPLPGANRSSRLMFDEGSGRTTHVFFADTTADIDGATWTDGVQGPGLTEGVDYRWDSTNPAKFVALAGGYLDGAPIVYFQGVPSLLVRIGNMVGSGVGLLAIGVVVGAAALLLGLFDDL